MAITKEKLYELLAYGFFPSGIGFNNVNIGKPLLTYKQLIKTKPLDNVNLDAIESILLQNLQRYKDKKLTLLFSGGIDSTYLAILMLKLDIDFNLLHIKFGKYDESAFAKKIAKNVLHMPLTILKYNRKNTKKIISQMNAPYERGSVILTHTLLHSKHCRDYVVAGDSADCLFMPSFKKEHIAIKTNQVTSSSLRKDILSQMGVKYYQHASSALEQMQLFDILNEIPYYYASKYQMFKRPKQTIILPYQDVRLLKASFACKELHAKDHKFYLKELVKPYTKYRFIKKAFKVDKKEILPITKEVHKMFKLYELDKFKFTAKEKKKVLFLLALVLQWTKSTGSN